jgi:hypothetical protein
MKADVGLTDIDAALKGSAFSVPRDKLRLFGHVVLRIDGGDASLAQLAAALEAIDTVSVAESRENKDHLLVTVQMPYPVVANRPSPDWVGWEKFARNDYSSAKSNSIESEVTRQMLPDYGTLRDVLASHNARLDDVRWSTAFACRALGCVTAPGPDTAVASAAE